MFTNMLNNLNIKLIIFRTLCAPAQPDLFKATVCMQYLMFYHPFEILFSFFNQCSFVNVAMRIRSRIVPLCEQQERIKPF